ncbi:RNA exonuclease 4 isoform X1 [Cricetulus griseus]|uniref:RNA exonuclease 4 n=1 Tax=Cricetulus griseus TaxID=10029 RepID=A0A9J7JW28_CRIGR|nr:RNA exonuclease 4 isoform X1 [Cricetulus griseus]ERE71379.1 RNA exonuclease 4-like protein [Cricetulus griseus]
MKAKATAPVSQPEPIKELVRKKARKRFRKSKAQGGSVAPGSLPAAVAVRPPKAPENFSQNWKALQELLKQKSQAPEKPLVSQMDDKMHPQIIQQNKKETSDKAKGDGKRTEKDQTIKGSVTALSKKDRKRPVPPTNSSGPEQKKSAQKRTFSDNASHQEDIKHKWKAKEVAVVLNQSSPTEEDIWFDDVDPDDIEAAIGPEAAMLVRKRLGQKSKSTISLVKEQAFGGLTKALALDCEMVGVGPKGEESIAARVSIVNQYGKCVYDKYVKPTEPVTDYRTAVSGIRPENLKQGEEFEVVKKEVAEMLKGRTLVGHALHNDLKVLFLDHPKKKIRDTQKFKPFRSQVRSGKPSLKQLSEKILGIRVQQAEHCSIHLKCQHPAWCSPHCPWDETWGAGIPRGVRSYCLGHCEQKGCLPAIY